MTLAVIKFQQALELNPNLPYTDPQAEAERLARNTAANRVAEGLELAQQGHLKDALAKIAETQKLEANYEIPAETWHALCTQGGQWDQPELVLAACNQAIELNPENGLYHNSRGLVHSLLGNHDDAREDFKAFEAWMTAGE